MRVVIVDPNILKFHAYENGVLVRVGKAVSGRPRCIENARLNCATPSGVHKVLRKYGPSKRSIKYPIGCKGRECARMSYFMKFSHNGEGLHASDDIKVNHNASHGCVRLYREDARWLNKEFVRVGDVVVVVKY